MSTAQQLGLIGNSIKVQSLPTASAETFGAGNRFYTLIGQQEGYITGHTYHTIVANDVYSWEDVAGGNYNMLDNIPVINQDLSASGFTPVTNTYYRHTGATTDTFTQGVIYLYDTAYHKLGESGGGTTLNRYEVTTGSGALLNSIINTAKSVNVCTLDVNGYKIIMFKEDSSDCCGYYYGSKTIDNSIHIIKYVIRLYKTGTRNIFAIDLTTGKKLQDASGLSVGDCYILYYNDTEIT